MTFAINPFADRILTKTDIGFDASQPLNDHDETSSHGVQSSQQGFLTQLVTTGEGEMARNRLVISGAILIYFVVEALINSRALQLPLTVISLFFMFSAILAWHIATHPKPHHQRRVIALIGDIGTLSIGLIIGADVTAFTFPVYLWVIFGNGFRFGLKFLSLASLAATVCFACVMATTPYWQNFYNLSFGLLFSLIVLPLYARKLIKDLSDARQKAEQANEMKTLFLASVSHELRTPLNAVIGLSELLSSTKLDREQREMSASINASGRSLCGLIDNFLDYSRLEAGAMPTTDQSFCLMSLCAELESTARAQAHKKNIKIGLHITPKTPMSLFGDRGKLMQILTNLLGNAIKFTDDGAVTLVVDAVPQSASKTLLCFEVRDTGIGISQDAQEHVFDRFRQANARIVDQYGGTGLGLAIVQQVVALLGGEITIESSPGKGSTFSVDLPMKIDTKAAKPSPEGIFNVAILSHNPDRVRAAIQSLGHKLVTTIENREDLKAWAHDMTSAHSNALLVFDDDSHIVNTIGTINLDVPCLRTVMVTHEKAASPMRISKHVPPFAIVQANSLDHDLAVVCAGLEALHACWDTTAPIDCVKTHQQPLSILVAEDNHANQMVIQKILEHAGHNAIIAGDGEAALDALTNHEFDILLLDLNMPKLNGFEVLKFAHFALHEDDVPILALTADASEDTRQKCLKAGFDACITKPYNTNLLLKTIVNLTSHSGTSDLIQNTCHGHEQKSSHAKRTKRGQQTQNARSEPLQSESLDQTHPQEAIEFRRLETLMQLGDATFFSHLVNEFEVEGRSLIRDLKAATENENYEKIRKLAHALKSSAVNFGAVALVELCESLELGVERDLKNLAFEKVKQLELEFETVSSVLIGHTMAEFETTLGVQAPVHH